MRFVDEAKAFVKAGNGGDGAIAFLREKFRPFGGPAGGDGGRGGDVIFEADESLSTLLDFKYRPRLAAADGAPGRGKQRYGRAGADLIVKVPLGTMVFDADEGELLADLALPGQREVIARAGTGGRGNMHFASSTRRAPRIATPGTAGEQRWVRMELRLVADAGLVGLPNAGKSTLLKALSRAHPKIAPYPFTTLQPHLGRVFHSPGESFVLADVPGLIKGAHEGHGLGIRFLRHLYRTRTLVFVLDLSGNPADDFETVRSELGAFDNALLHRPAVIALNKSDLVSCADASRTAKHLAERTGFEAFAISARDGLGLQPLVEAVASQVSEAGGDYH